MEASPPTPDARMDEAGLFAHPNRLGKVGHAPRVVIDVDRAAFTESEEP
ncbi:hypothetical protein H3U87_02645 [Bifidobacterium sp. W8101]|nr:MULTISPECIES: hypothetical protein [Bifidobacterium]MBI0126043.1 hypothetical protein [Bifidobacterium choladohabitans]MBI0127612.1 hypothetical protein [Bifidobacterium sp. W8103]MBI0138200.1 hypothetical protein [Bifidobacterium sp. W8105]